MLESWNLSENLENKWKNLDKNNRVDEKTIIFRLKSLDKLYKSKIDKKLASISEQWTSKQLEDFRKEASLIYEEHQEILAKIEEKILSIWDNELNLYLEAIEELKTELDSFENESKTIDITWIGKENLQWVERLKYVEKVVYNGLWIDKGTYNNWWWWQFCKWIIDEVILWNAELINLVYEEWIWVVIDMMEQLFSREWLQEIVKQLWISITDLFTGNAYEKWRSFWQLGLVVTWWWLAFSGWKKLVSIWKNLAKKWLKWGVAELWFWLTIESWWMINLIKNLPEQARSALNGILKAIGKAETIILSWKTIEWAELVIINKFIKAFQINHKLFWDEQYAYMSSAAMYMLIKNHNILPWDLDVAVNPKKMTSFVDNIVSEIWSNSDISKLTFLELSWNGKIKHIPIENIDEIKRIASEWRLNISYEIEWLEVELFPEVDGKWLTNLWYMEKNIVFHKIEKWWETIVEVPSLDNKWVSQWYVMNYLDEFGNSSMGWIEWKIDNGIGLGKIKMKDANRVNSIYILLKDAWLIENPEQLLRFIDDTVEKYEALPTKWPYVKSAIETKNVVEGVEKLRNMIDEFYDELWEKIDSWLLKEWNKLPVFKEFSDNLSKDKIKAYELYQKYLENWDKVTKKKLLELLDSVQKNIDKVKLNISKIDDFSYYYETENSWQFIRKLRKNLSLNTQ